MVDRIFRRKTSSACALLFDIGGTYLRWGLWWDGGLRRWGEFPHAAFSTPSSAIEQALAEAELGGRWRGPVLFCVAGPVWKEEATLTNRPKWSFAPSALGKAFGWKTVRLVNDLTALALGVSHREAKGEVWQLGEAGGELPVPRIVVAVGTGLGNALCLGPFPQWVWSGEAGHSDLPMEDSALFRALSRKLSHLSRETVLCGHGLALLYRVLLELEDKAVERVEPGEVSQRAAERTDPIAVRACSIWSELLGKTVGDVVLVAGAWKGCDLAGGVISGMGKAFDRTAFLAGFHAKDRMGALLLKVPVRFFSQRNLALLGLGLLLESRGLSKRLGVRF